MASSEFMLTSLISGGFAGITCDIILYPIDTIKTRLQSKEGFLKAGGFRSIYRGIGSVALGSIPNASSFFIAYDTSKLILPKLISHEASIHMVGGCIGEIVSCCVRMPFEVVKQTAQAGNGKFSSRTALAHVIRRDGLLGLYSGFYSTITRDIPYCVIQMPIWEGLKTRTAAYYSRDVTAFESGVCGSIAGGVAAALTTPLDVAKTRIILTERGAADHSENPFRIMYQIIRKEGFLKLFAGVTPRVAWISAGGFIYFGAYEFTKIVICGNYLFSK